MVLFFIGPKNPREIGIDNNLLRLLQGPCDADIPISYRVPAELLLVQRTDQERVEVDIGNGYLPI